MTQDRQTTLIALACVMLLGAPQIAGAYETYSDCAVCHGSFLHSPYLSPSGNFFPTDLHTLHKDPSYMGSSCGLCHFGENGNPWIGWSEGTNSNQGFGCAGCHGRLGTQWPRAWGLVLVHELAGETCTDCHDGVQQPDPEDELPPYYATPDTNVAAPCNDDGGTSEDWSGDGDGLDNDGDGDVDLWDWDCDPCIDGDGDGFGAPGALTCTGGGQEDCDDTNPDIHPGQTETICDLVDNDCDPATPDAPDTDGDGYTGCDECDDGNSAVNPGMAEICDDTLDNDCDGAVDEDDDECTGDDDGGDDDDGDDDDGDDDGSDDDGAGDDDEDEGDDEFIAPSDCQCQEDPTAGPEARSAPALLSLALLFRGWRRRR
jgi:Putative metal-binding motif